jgi:hypothetical protein
LGITKLKMRGAIIAALCLVLLLKEHDLDHNSASAITHSLTLGSSDGMRNICT